MDSENITLSLAALRDVGAFTGAPVLRSVQWKKGEDIYQFDVYVKPLSYSSAVSDIEALNGKHEFAAGRIAASICDEKGTPIFTVDEITGKSENVKGEMDGNLVYALLTVIGEVNGFSKKNQ